MGHLYVKLSHPFVPGHQHTHISAHTQRKVDHNGNLSATWCGKRSEEGGEDFPEEMGTTYLVFILIVWSTEGWGLSSLPSDKCLPLISIDLCRILGGRHCYLHLINENTEAQKLGNLSKTSQRRSGGAWIWTDDNNAHDFFAITSWLPYFQKLKYLNFFKNEDVFVIPDELDLEVGKYQRCSVQSAAGWMKRSTAKPGSEYPLGETGWLIPLQLSTLCIHETYH